MNLVLKNFIDSMKLSLIGGAIIQFRAEYALKFNATISSGNRRTKIKRT